MEKAYIARQKILDDNNNLIAYELLFRDHADGIKEFPTNLKATSHVVMNILTNMNIKDVIPRNVKAFVNIDETILLSGIIDILDKKIFVLEILETTQLSDKMIKKLAKYHKAGYKIAIDDFDCSPEMIKKFTPILKYVSLFKIDVKDSNIDNLKNIIPKLKKMNKLVLAEKVETKEEYNLYKNMGFDLFQGHYLCKPDTMEIKLHKEATHLVILQLIGLIKKDDDTLKIERFLKSRPDLSFKLMRYLNNENNFESEIDSITQVITLMGREKLMRWLLLYLYSDISNNPLSDNVLSLAQNRAQKMEKDAPAHMKDKAYIAGMFSMLDILFDTDMRELLSYVKMDKEIVEFVTTKTGRFSKSFQAIEKKEKADLKKVVCEQFDELNIEDVLYALEFAGIKLKI